MEKIGFIGAGNMARAIMGGLIRNGVQNPENIMVRPGLHSRTNWTRRVPRPVLI